MCRWLVVLIVSLAGLVGAVPRVAAQPSLPDSAYVNGFEGHAQSYNLSCESRSAVDWAAFFGVTLSETTFLLSLPSSDNPDVGYVGFFNDPWGNTPPASYGVHAAPVADLLRANGVPAIARRGLHWDDLRREIVNGRPVIVWVVGNVWQGTPLSYTASDGHTTTVAAYEHTMTLVGYDPTAVYLVNASSGQVEGHTLANFLSSWAVLGNMAVLAAEPEPAPAPSVNTYVVQAGDSLLTIAAGYSLSWHELAVYNNLDTPDVIYVGQVLRIPSAADEGASDGVEVEGEETAVAPVPDAPATYTVQRGDHLMQIARTLGLDWQIIADLNNLTPPQYVVYPGQVLELGPAQAAPAPPETAAVTTYVVQAGDTLHKIARRFGLEWPALAQANALTSPNQIYVGQVLQIP